MPDPLCLPSPAASRYLVRVACTRAEVEAAQRLRHLAFYEGRGLAGDASGLDADSHDALCRHVLIIDRATGSVICCFRLMMLERGARIGESYSARHYGLSALAGFSGPMIEIGRFCIHPQVRDADVMRLAWAWLAALVDKSGARLIFGCSSFHGTDAAAYEDAFALLGRDHLAPRRWRPRVKAPRVFRFAVRLAGRVPDRRRAMMTMPPLLRSYLAMGGWVSDHAVVDGDLDTLHVFTGLEIGAIPAARARLLRAIAPPILSG